MDEVGNNWSSRCFPLGQREAATWTVRPDESGFHPRPAVCWPDDLAIRIIRNAHGQLYSRCMTSSQWQVLGNSAG